MDIKIVLQRAVGDTLRSEKENTQHNGNTQNHASSVLDYLHASPEQMLMQIKREVVKRRKALIPTDREFFAIASRCKNYGATANKLNFAEYKGLRDMVVPIAQRYFNASTFLKLPIDRYDVLASLVVSSRIHHPFSCLLYHNPRLSPPTARAMSMLRTSSVRHGSGLSPPVVP